MDIKEILSKMKPEHQEVIEAAIEKANGDLTAANEALAKANEELETLKANPLCECDGEMGEDGLCKTCGKPKNAVTNSVTKKVCATCGAEITGDVCEECTKASEFDEAETLKAMPEAARELFTKMKAQRELAEEELRKANEAKLDAEATAKAEMLKALPIEKAKLVDLVKKATPDMVDALETISKAIESTVLAEVGKSTAGSDAGAQADAWAKIEAKADDIAKRDNITKQKAVGVAVKENPDLYREYLAGGAN